ncbi:hypothetical protein Sjap_003995 [Stephania japonica]|uniref:Pentatricopeptide repeat-containing protein n=1 Tax=Stephania japonica TaxID=461633 RepID=A0AAP0K3N3_9MAGN
MHTSTCLLQPFTLLTTLRSDGRRDSVTPSSSHSTSSSSTTTSCSTVIVEETPNPKKFSYDRASPTVRWPHLTLTQHSTPPHTPPPPLQQLIEHEEEEEEEEEEDPNPQLLEKSTQQALDCSTTNDESQEVLGRPSKTKIKKMNKLALKRAKDWRQRVQFLTDKILQLQPDEFVADVLDSRPVQMTPTDYCFVVKWVGKSSWHRALEVYEWLNLRHWYTPNARMLATILSVLGKANQESLAEEIFDRAEPGVWNSVQVYNAMMGVYSRNGRFSKVQDLLNLMKSRGCEPDLVSFNTLINARAKSSSMSPGLAIELLKEVRRSGLRPDIITYNTLISASSREFDLDEAVKVYADLQRSNCQPDLWTYNAMISVFGRCGMTNEAERLFKELGVKGFFPDAVTYNSLLYAFAREGNVGKVMDICEKMIEAGFGKDEMTYNTIIHMYGKQGHHELALRLYNDMKSSGRSPDAVTYTVLVDSLGKTGKVKEAAMVMSEMLDAGVKPTLRTFSALICAYAKAGMRDAAEETFNCMLRSGIKADRLAYSVMLDIFLRFNETKKSISLYNEMVRDGFTPDQSLYEDLLKLLSKDDKEDAIQMVLKDMEEVCGMTPQIISNALVKGGCHEHAAKLLRLAIRRGYQPDRENLLFILNSHHSDGKHEEAKALLNALREHSPSSNHLVTEASIIMLCKNHQIEAALKEYVEARSFVFSSMSCSMYESLIQCCEETGFFAEASQIYSDMKFCCLEPSKSIYQSLVLIYCKMGFPETAHHLVNLAESLGFMFNGFSPYIDLIEAYGKLNLWEKAESVVGRLRLSHSVVDRKVWNALIHSYAASGCYERARAVFNTMIRDGPSPTVDSINGLMQALIVDGRLDELYVVIQELQDMGFKISKSTILLMLDAFARARNIFEVKKIYNGMKAAGYLPTMHLYRSMIALFSRGKRVRDVESMFVEMEKAGFKPDLSIFNSMLSMYTGIGDFRKTVEVYQNISGAGMQPDENTYNTLILMYCRDFRPEEGISLLQEMRRQELEPKLDTYKSLITACGKQQMWEHAEELFIDLQSKGFKLDRGLFHIMMKIYRDQGNHIKAENLLLKMKETGVEPTIATMHLLMVSYSSAKQPKEAENVLNNLKTSGLVLSTLPYSSVIDGYLKNGDYNMGIEKLKQMIQDGLEPDHRIWTCFIRAASISQSTDEAMILLNSLRDTGFDIPIRLLTEKTETLVDKMDNLLSELGPLDDDAAFNFVNALEDLLWAFECRATASWVFQLAIKRMFTAMMCANKVADRDWGADFRKLSAGAALVATWISTTNMLWRNVNFWLPQDASLQGCPEAPKSVVLITGMAEYNMVSLNNTIKAYLWEMGSPFLPCKTRSGLLVAKAHSLRMWLKDSPYCLDLELKDASSLPKTNSMQLNEGYFMRSGLVPIFKEVHERLGQVRPKKFARLALLSDEKREKAIKADIEGREQKLQKMKERGWQTRPKRRKTIHRKRFIRKLNASRPNALRLGKLRPAKISRLALLPSKEKEENKSNGNRTNSREHIGERDGRTRTR